MALCRITVMLMLTTLTEGENQITDEVSLTLLGAPRESIELSQKKPQKVEMFLLGFFIPFLTLTLVYFCGFLSLSGFPVVDLLE